MFVLCLEKGRTGIGHPPLFGRRRDWGTINCNILLAVIAITYMEYMVSTGICAVFREETYRDFEVQLHVLATNNSNVNVEFEQSHKSHARSFLPRFAFRTA